MREKGVREGEGVREDLHRSHHPSSSTSNIDHHRRPAMSTVIVDQQHCSSLSFVVAGGRCSLLAGGGGHFDRVWWLWSVFADASCCLWVTGWMLLIAGMHAWVVSGRSVFIWGFAVGC